MFEKNEGVIENGQSRDAANIGHKTQKVEHRKIGGSSLHHPTTTYIQLGFRPIWVSAKQII